MREKLKERLWERSRYRGTFSKYGLKPAYKGWPPVTILLTNVQIASTGEPVTDHLWLNETKKFHLLAPLYPGDVVAFDGRVRPYEKGYVSEREDVDERETDYKLSHPTHVSILKRLEQGANHYETCPRCGYHNDLDAEACRRCHQWLTEPPEPPKTEPVKTYAQTTLVSSRVA